MNLASRLLLLALVNLLQPAFPQLSWAQPQLQTQASAKIVEVGRPFTVRLKANGTKKPDSPRIDVPKGFRVSGPSVGTSQQMSFTNGQLSSSVGITATWQLTPSKLGEYSVGPASVNTQQGRVKGEPFRIRVVPVGQAPDPAPQKRRRSLFDDEPPPGFGGIGRSLFADLFQNPQLSRGPEAPAEYHLDYAPDDVAFLRASVDKRKVVIGEQVTLKIYAYGGRGRFNENSPTEPRRQNFFSFPIVERSGREPLYVTNIGDRQFHAAKLREIALFPLSTGRHEIGPMTIKFYGSNYITRLSREGLERKSNSLIVEVVEPPAKGRPTGYRIGDVGTYRLKASVAPQRIEAGGSIAVTATLTGIGNLPTQLRTPDQHDVEWLTPTLNDQIEVRNDHRIGGTRTFSYVVRLSKPGKVTLGEITLPYYDAAARRYRVATASLGSVVVAPSTLTDDSQLEQETEKSSSQAVVRPVEGHYPEPDPAMSDQAWFWLLAFGAPFGLSLSQAASSSLQGLRRRRRAQVNSLAQKVRSALDAATAAQSSGDTGIVFANIERAVFAKIEACSGLRARAILKSQLGRELTQAGLSDADADALTVLLSKIESSRFGAREDGAEEILKQSKALLKSLPDRVRELEGAT